MFGILTVASFTKFSFSAVLRLGLHSHCPLSKPPKSGCECSHQSTKSGFRCQTCPSTVWLGQCEYPLKALFLKIDIYEKKIDIAFKMSQIFVYNLWNTLVHAPSGFIKCLTGDIMQVVLDERVCVCVCVVKKLYPLAGFIQKASTRILAAEEDVFLQGFSLKHPATHTQRWFSFNT